MYTVDLFRNGQFLVCLGHFSNKQHAINCATALFETHGGKAENSTISWQVNQIILDGEGDIDGHVTIFSREAK